MQSSEPQCYHRSQSQCDKTLMHRQDPCNQAQLLCALTLLKICAIKHKNVVHAGNINETKKN